MTTVPTWQTWSPDQLATELAAHDVRYHQQAQPTISDAEYDAMRDHLRALAPDHPYLQRVGAATASADGKVVHARPMLSLDKCTDEEGFFAWLRGVYVAATGKGSSARVTREEVLQWADQTPEATLLVTPKIDGLACSLLYDAEGKLLLAATRGDGTVGEDVTHNVRKMTAIPQQLGPDWAWGPVEVRGEIYLPLSVFADVADTYANPRNLAAGTLKSKDNPALPPAKLAFLAYDLRGAGVPAAHQLRKSDRLGLAQSHGFLPAPITRIAAGEAVAEFGRWVERRPEVDFEADGIVLEVDDDALFQRLGLTAHHPRGAVAWKFAADAGTTTLQEVEWSVSRTGTITPVAIVAPVVLTGASVTRATLHNVSNLRRLGLRVGDQVELVRRGGVIPHVERVLQASAEPPVEPPTQCPACGGPAQLRQTTAGERVTEVLFCAQPETCVAARQRQLLHFCAAVEMEGFGDKVLDVLLERGLVQDPADLFTLAAGDLQTLPRFGPVLVRNLLTEVDKARVMALPVFLRALGIESLGKQTALLLASRWDLPQLRALEPAELAALHSLGEKSAEMIVQGLRQAGPLIDRLLGHVQVTAPEVAGASAGPLAGQVLVFTGKLERCLRAAAQKRAVELGGLAGDSVTDATTLLVVGGDELDSPTPSSKLKKARKLVAGGHPIQILSEDAYYQRFPEAAP